MTRTHNGAIPVVLPSSLLLPISALPTLHYPMTMADGVILLALILTSPCLCSLRLLSTVPELSPSFTAGMYFVLFLFLLVPWVCPSPSRGVIFMCLVFNLLLLSDFLFFHSTGRRKITCHNVHWRACFLLFTLFLVCTVLLHVFFLTQSFVTQS